LDPRSALNRALTGRARIPRDLPGIARHFGATPSEQAANIAEALSGTSTRGAREYRNARQNWRRWVHGERRPSATSMIRLQVVLRRQMGGRRLQRILEQGATLELEGAHGPIAVSASPRRSRRGTDVVDALDDEAVRRFAQQFGQSYAGNPNWTIVHVDRLVFRPGHQGVKSSNSRTQTRKP
jgi:hypothetical protein